MDDVSSGTIFAGSYPIIVWLVVLVIVMYDFKFSIMPLRLRLRTHMCLHLRWAYHITCIFRRLPALYKKARSA